MIRTPRASDQGYIASTWARSVLSTHATQRHFRSRTGTQVNEQIDRVMDRADTRALLRVKPHDPNVILAWLVYCEGPGVPMVHYMYCRRDERGRGYTGELLERLSVTRTGGVVCTSTGPSSESMRGRYRASVHVPLAEFLLPEVKEK